jgi:hypothetical protein
MQYTNDNDEDFDGFRYPSKIVCKAAKIVEKYAPHAAKPIGSSGWWVYTNAIAFAFGDGQFATSQHKIERAAQYLKISPTILYNDPDLQA